MKVNIKKWQKLIFFSISIFLLIGLPAGTSVFTFYYGKGFSYLSNDPKACINCHIMKDQYTSWSKSGHQHVARCNDCHAPQDFIGKMWNKMSNGYHHSVAFTSGNFDLPIKIKEHNKQITLNACLYCHDKIIDSNHTQQKNCLHCHRDVAHNL